MSYQNLPDPRPLGVRLALGAMPRIVAVTLLVIFVGLALVGIIGVAIDNAHIIVWGGAAVVGTLLALQYVLGIRWNDMHKSWPRRRSYRRHRQMR